MKVVLNPAQLASQDLSASITIPLPELFAYFGLAIQFNFTEDNDLAGSLSMQVSVDGTNFVTYTGFTAITAFTTSVIWSMEDKMFPFKHAQLVYESTSGEGEADIWIDGVRV